MKNQKRRKSVLYDGILRYRILNKFKLHSICNLNINENYTQRNNVICIKTQNVLFSSF